VYSDEGISGTSTKHRDSFNRMIQDAMAGKIDLIITKSISRFARNTVDTLTTVRKLKEKGIEVFFEKENIYTLDSKGELLITIMSSIAQEESRSISENVTWGQRKRFADGKVSLPYKHFLGYRKGENGVPEVVPEEAQIVRDIYRQFLEGATPNMIANQLTEQGIPTPGGKKKWPSSTVESILTNEKYKGDALLQKKYTVDYLTKKQKVNEGEVTQYYVTGSHEGIVSPEVFDLVQHERERRRSLAQAYSASDIFASRIICGECGNLYGCKVWNSNSKYRRIVWRCNAKYRKRQGSADCHTPHLTEKQIKKAFVGAFNSCIKNKSEIITGCKEAIALVCNTEKLEESAAAYSEECEVTAELIRKCIEENAHVSIKPEVYRDRYNALAERYKAAKEKLDAIQQEISERTIKREKIEIFLKQLSKANELLTEFDEGLWNTMLDSMTVYSYEKVVFLFKDGSKVEWKIEK
ncbi:MAG: recombinase family protein, partial [Oscillospiraceae bacterium]|nr:recombinase family protein [Oscillospiraceae bacterium]